jgi:Na+-transporting NADH:ubiquinone oxidoreductase subunit B
MKLFKNLFDSIRPPFEKGGKFEKLWPLLDGFETFMFVPGHATHKGSHIRDGIDLKRTMITVVIALIPCLLFGMYNVGYQHFAAIGQDAEFMEMFIYGALKVLPLVIVSYGVGLGIEFIFCIKNGHSIQEGFLVSGMLIPLIMPVEVPLWMVAVSTAFAVVFGKEVFGGTGMNILNPALTARAFLFFAYPTKMSGNSVWVATDGAKTVDGFTGATALGNAIEQGIAGVPDYMMSIIGLIPGSIGETSVIAILIGAFILIYTGIGSWKIMLSMLVGGYAMGMIFNVFAVNPYMEVPAHHQLMLGGFFFGMVFMATDPVSAAQTEVGKWIYGFFCGVFGIMIRVFNPAYPEGIMMAILFMNVMAPMIDHYVIQSNINKRLKRAKAAA